MAYLILPLKLTNFIPHLSSWRALLLVNNIPSIIAFVGFLFLHESPKFLLAQGLYAEALEVLRKIFKTNTGKPEDSYPSGLIVLNEKSTGLNNTKGFGEAVKLMGKQTLQLFHKKRILQTMNMSIIDLIVCIIGAGFTMWLPTVLSSFNDPHSEFLTVCAAIGISKNHSTDICSNPNGLETSHFKTLVFIAMILIFCFLISSVAVGFIGRKIILSEFFFSHLKVESVDMKCFFSVLVLNWRYFGLNSILCNRSDHQDSGTDYGFSGGQVERNCVGYCCGFLPHQHQCHGCLFCEYDE